MSEQIREQVSAFLDGELPNSETELLLKRLTRDPELRESFGLYSLIGEALRGSTRVPLTRDFAVRVNQRIDGEPVILTAAVSAAPHHWWRPLAAAAIAASVAVVAVVGLERRADAPALAARVSPEALSYTVPAAQTLGSTALPPTRLANYVFAHSKYSSALGQRSVLSGLVADQSQAQTQATLPSNDPLSPPAPLFATP